jgi:fructoselysine-6-P-deglycase FrlB-like protein
MNDLEQIMHDWHAGKSVRVLKLGHSREFRQVHAYEGAFGIVVKFAEEGKSPESFAAVALAGDEVTRELNLTNDEQAAATSLAWIALRNGWAKAIAGHPEHQYITLTREASAA